MRARRPLPRRPRCAAKRRPRLVRGRLGSGFRSGRRRRQRSCRPSCHAEAVSGPSSRDLSRAGGTRTQSCGLEDPLITQTSALLHLVRRTYPKGDSGSLGGVSAQYVDKNGARGEQPAPLPGLGRASSRPRRGCPRTDRRTSSVIAAEMRPSIRWTVLTCVLDWTASEAAVRGRSCCVSFAGKSRLTARQRSVGRRRVDMGLAVAENCGAPLALHCHASMFARNTGTERSGYQATREAKTGSCGRPRSRPGPHSSRRPVQVAKSHRHETLAESTPSEKRLELMAVAETLHEQIA